MKTIKNLKEHLRGLWRWLISAIFSRIFSKEVLAASIGAGVLIWGYTLDSTNQRELEKFKIKSAIYSTFLNQISKSTTTSREELDTIHSAMYAFYMYAPDCVIRDVNNSFNYTVSPPMIDRSAHQKIRLILHNDINNPKDCDDITPKPDDFVDFMGIW